MSRLRLTTLSIAIAALSWATPRLAEAGDWEKIEAGGPPPARVFHGMAYDSNRGVLVVASGSGMELGNLSNDVWEFDGSSWSGPLGSGGPSPRNSVTMTFDGQGAVLFGGKNENQQPDHLENDTWVWNGGWSGAGTGPQARSSAAMAYDSLRDVVVMMGGEGFGESAIKLPDTWQWSPGAGSWSAGASGPTGRSFHGMGFDGERVIVFGGQGADGAPLGDTWAFDGAAWDKVSDEGPSPRHSPAMSGDGIARVFLYGGADGTGDLGGTWVWDGASWTEVTPDTTTPPNTSRATMAWDGERLLMFGGWNPGVNNDLWAYTPEPLPPSDDTTGTSETGDTGDTDTDTDTAGSDDSSGCGCRASEPEELAPLAVLVAIVIFRRRRR